ncbi:hypothetical protein [Methanospirillum hungatei]|uniref:hypothetical protein n=1 Tax=Methanospirillum hungatei TaxID=2203 RepID=UPI0026F2A310|nr:hypothetical protein [Methanospirillum hungatei]MCA1917045.1 hypothetical protein [Methanospirillum hungatei]
MDTKAILDPVRELKEKSYGEKFSPVFSDQVGFFSGHSSHPPLIDPDNYGPINWVWGGPCAVCDGSGCSILRSSRTR